MKLRYKILYMSFGAALVVLGIVLNSLVTDANAQDDNEVLTIKEIRCKRLVVGDGDNQLSVSNGYIHCNGVVVKKSITLVDDKFNFRGKFALDTDGNANLKIYGEDGRTAVAYLGLNKGENGEIVFDLQSKSKTDKRSVSIGINENGGRFDAFDKSGASVGLSGKYRDTK